MRARRSRRAIASAVLLTATSTDRVAAEPAIAGVSYTVDAVSNLSGGARRGGGLLQKLVLSFEPPIAAGWSVFASVQGLAGAKPSAERVEDLQVVDNIEAPNSLTLAEAWVARTSQNQAWETRVGLIDLNRTFDVQELGALFLNSSFGVGPDLGLTGPRGPSIFPRPGLGAALAWTPREAWSVRVGAFDGAPGGADLRPSLTIGATEGALLIAEAEHRSAEIAVKTGLWSYTSRTPAGDVSLRPSSGAYLQAQSAFWGERLGGDPVKGWIRVGLTDGAVTPVAAYVGGGLLRDNVWQAGDSLGLAVAHARPGASRQGDDGRNAAETVVELTYRWALTPWLQIQPDVQYVMAPGGLSARPDAAVIGVRLQADLAR